VSALALAERTGAQEIVAMLKNHEAMKAAPTIQATSAAPATPSPVASQSIAQGQPLPSIPPELKAKIDQQIDAMPLSPEQKDAQRAAQYLNVQKVLRSVDSIKAASSQ
jgi:hypothetical protein